MKKDLRKLYWTIIIVWGILASISGLLFAAFEGKEIGHLFWGFAYWSIVALIVLSILFALGFALSLIVRGFIDDPKKQMGIIVGLGTLIVVFVASYLISSGNDIPQELFEKTGTSFGSSKFIGACLYMVYILFAGVILTAAYSEVSKKIK